MPIAGMITWGALGIAAAFLPERSVANASLYIMAAILPLAFVIDRLRGRNLFGGGDNPLVQLFLRGIIMVALTIPLAVIGAKGGQPLLVLLSMAILAGVVWIPFGWAADDPAARFTRPDAASAATSPTLCAPRHGPAAPSVQWWSSPTFTRSPSCARSGPPRRVAQTSHGSPDQVRGDGGGERHASSNRPHRRHGPYSAASACSLSACWRAHISA
jgi:hypothetical protein